MVTELADSGPGIAPEVAPRLFEAFVTHGKEHGTGLGISICKRILEDHQGWISARNAPGGGAVFSFGLPRLPSIGSKSNQAGQEDRPGVGEGSKKPA